MAMAIADLRADLEQCLRVRPIAAVLLDAGFEPARGTPSGDTSPDALIWFGEYCGWTLKILAGVDWFGQWKLVGTSVSQREAMWNERLVLEDAPQGAVVEMLIKLWQSAFRDAPCPDAFRLGRVYREWNAVRRKLNPGMPHLDVDGRMLRMVVNRKRPANPS